MNLQKTIREALQEKNPNLFQQLQASGKLREFCLEREDEILEAVSNAMGENLAVRKAWSPKSGLTLIQKAAVANTQQAMIREQVLAAYLEFPQDEIADETSSSRPED